MTDDQQQVCQLESASTKSPGSPLFSMIKWDVRLQVRYGFYTVYAALTAVFILGLRIIGPQLRADAAILLIVTDPAILGFYFIAALVLFEKREGVLDALVVSPLGERGYLISKVITLSTLATVAATVVAVFGHGFTPRLLILILGIILSASLFILIGFVAVARFNTINEYFISAVGWGTVVFLPLAGYLGVVSTPLFYLLPAKPVLLLVEAGFRRIPQLELTYAFGYLLLGNVVVYSWAQRAFRQHIVRGGDHSEQLKRDKVPERESWSDRELSNRSPWVGMVKTDLRNWVRDPMLGLAAVGPLLLAIVIKFGFSTISDLAMPVLDLSLYLPVITGAMAIFGPEIYGFIIGMFILEDREQGVIEVYRTSPLSTRGYLIYRGLTAYVLSLGATLPAVVVINQGPTPFSVLAVTVLVGALGGPLIAFAFGTFSSNTIEGLALSKIVNMITIVPAAVVAIIPEPYQFVVGVVPMYWIVKMFVTAATGNEVWVVYLFIGVATHLLLIVSVSRLFATRID